MRQAGIISIILIVALAASGVLLFSGKKAVKKENVISEKVVLDEIGKFSFENPEELGYWEERALAARKTAYSPAEFMGKKAVKAASENSASILLLRQVLSQEKNPYLAWDWVVEKFPEHKTEEVLDDKKEFDFGAQFYVVFGAKFFLNAKAIQYVWTETLPAGTIADSPYTSNVKILVLESGRSEGWKHEERDIIKDYEMLFGKEPTDGIAGIGFMTDADSTKSTASAYYADIRFGFKSMERVYEEKESVEVERPAIVSWLMDRFSWKNKQK